MSDSANRRAEASSGTLIAAKPGATVAAMLRSHCPGMTWTQARQRIAGRHVRINGNLCLDPARRLKEGDRVEILGRPMAKPPSESAIVIRHLDEHIVVVEKRAGINTVRHPAERDWSEKRKALSPTLDDLAMRSIGREKSRPPRGRLGGRLRVVHRLDKETSGLVVFARSVPAERGLGKQFHAHAVTRCYLAIVPGEVKAQTIESQLVRDRGDRRRGSSDVPGIGKKAVTHVEVAEALPGYTLLRCRLETGRTHQIRIHLAELGHPVCGEKVYNRQRDGSVIPDNSDASRLALHAAELGFTHPVTGKALHWEMPLPNDLQDFLSKLRRAAKKS
jgi:23S rRNA pseudouridine1911/1915/1917 synthase